MECNKEEAIRAKDIAERKMQIRDFIGAKKFLLKALHLFPDIENASHMLTVCEVHCSAESLVNGQTDHYGVLQVESSTDGALIRRQYRRFALLLHPDKNKFAGAEAAFKLVGEAYKVLSDQASRQVYDSKRRVQMRTVSSWKPSQNFKNAGSNSGATNYSSNNQPGGLKQEDKRQSSQFFSSQYFWSVCVYCNNLLCYSRALVNKEVQCQKCLKKVHAFEVRLQNVPPFGSSSGFPWRHTGLHRADVPSQHLHNHGSQTHFGNPSGVRVHENVVRPPNVSKPSKSVTATKHGPCSTNREEKAVSGGDAMVGNELKSENDKTGEKSAMRPSSRGADQIRHKRAAVNTKYSDYAQLRSKDNDNIMGVPPTDHEEGPTSGRYLRRSTRCKINVTCKEDESDDDFVCSPKRSRNVGSDGTNSRNISFPEVVTNGVKKKTNEIPTFEDKISGDQISMDHCEDNLSGGSVLKKRTMSQCKEAVCMKNEKHVRAGSNANFAIDSKSRSQVDFSFSYPDPEFYDFDMDRDQSKFAGNQIWAVYDDDDGMPRYYALIQKVFTPRFKLQYTWLEYNPTSSVEKAWVKAGLPTACGNFKLGKVCSTKCRQMFSHLICGEKGRGSTYNIYPKKGEVWALFNEWDMQWSSTEENRKKYSYEFVEVVSDYASGQDFTVSHLVKVRGFMYLFARSQDKGITVVPSGQLLKFSHCVPHCRVSVEREGIPRVSFELDPAALSESVVNITDAGGAHTGEVLGVNSSDPCPRPEADADKLESDVIKSTTLGPSQHVLETVSRKIRYHAFGNSDKNIEDSSSNGQESANLEFFDFQEDRPKKKFKQGQNWGLYSEIDDFVCSPKRSRNVGSDGTNSQNISFPEVVANDAKQKTNEIPTSEDKISGDQISVDHCEDNLSCGSVLMNRTMSQPKEAVCKKNEKHVRAGSNANFSIDSKSRSQVDFSFSYPDPEFYDFNLDRDQSKYARNQIWAVYDDDDVMPRYYALIQKVSTPNFKLQYAWLEYNPTSSAEKAWVEAGLPTACGNFKLGRVCSTKCQQMFSHLICSEKGRGSSYNIYPKKGEVWALFNEWDMQWSSAEENPRKYSYEFVEVVSDYASGQDFIVSHLVKVRGFMYLFARSQDKGITVVPSGQLLKFSHRVPHCRVSAEREGIPRVSFELDPAALSESVVNITDAGGAHTGEVLDVNSSDPCPRPEADADKLEGDVIKSTTLGPSQHVLETVSRKIRYHAFGNSDKGIEDSSSNGQESANLDFFDFQEDRSKKKFKQGQIWGLYSDIDEYPNYYVWVSAAGWETTGLNVKCLEFSPQTEEEKLWSTNGLPVSCGRFKVTSKVAQYDSTHPFSHLVHAKSLRRNNLFEIYPNSGEVWAVFNNWNLKWTSINFGKAADYSVVEVVERDNCVIKVMTLTKVNGYKYVFMPKIGSVADMEIPIDECLKFSHQIPAFRLTDQESGKLKDCWELDRDSIPKNLMAMKS